MLRQLTLRLPHVHKAAASLLTRWGAPRQFSMAHRVYVGNMPYSYSEADIESLFSTCGNIVHVNIIKDNMTQRSKGYGFVEFDSHDGVQSALEFAGANVSGRSILVNRAHSNKPNQFAQTATPQVDRVNQAPLASKVYVGNFTYSTTEADLVEMFQSCGPIRSVNIVRDKSAGNRSKGFGFVEFESEDSARLALQLNEAIVHGRNLIVKETTPPRATPENTAVQLDDTVYVANLPEDVDEETIQAMFQHCGDIERIRISYSPDLSRTFAHVKFATKGCVDEALSLNGADLEGITILVLPATRRAAPTS